MKRNSSYENFDDPNRNLHRSRKVNEEHNEDFTYEHFPVVCPSCKGTGEIEKDDSELVTFVPVKDKRLKPAWTKLKVFSLFIFLLVCGGLSTFFLYPRSVNIQVDAQNVMNFDFNKHIVPWMQYSFQITLKNRNYFSVNLRKISLSLKYQMEVVGEKNMTKDINVHLRSEVKMLVTMNVSYDNSADKIRKQCFEEKDYLGQFIRSSGELSYWMHSEHLTSNQDYFFVDCSTLVFPSFPTDKPKLKNLISYIPML